MPARYPVRLYPDITHCWSCQYPVPDWDPALAACQGREPINPRPADQAHIFALTAPHSIGALTYCEGNNDDLNKMVWSALLWDLDPAAAWRVVVVYGGERRWGGAHPRVRMDAGGAGDAAHEVHGWIAKPHPRGPLSFDLPAGAAADGSVTVRVYHEQSGGPGHGAQVSEIWLQRADRDQLETPPPERRP